MDRRSRAGEMGSDFAQKIKDITGADAPSCPVTVTGVRIGTIPPFHASGPRASAPF